MTSRIDEKPGMKVTEVLAAWGSILSGRVPMLSIEITRECPLACPGCYAYGETHLGGDVTLRDLSDLRGDALVNGVLGLVRKHKPLHVSLVGGEPMVRNRELGRILPALSEMGVFTLLVTSGVIPVPPEWTRLPRTRVAISVDGLPEHHDIRRKPATYERILKNIAGCRVNIHWTITHPMLAEADYVERYLAFWDARPETNRIWVSFYTPQRGEQTPEMLTREDRERLARELPPLRERYPTLFINEGVARAYLEPPRDPDDCIFSKMSTNYSADLQTRVEPCIFGGDPDCSQCGCAVSGGLHWLRTVKLAGPLKLGHLLGSSVRIGRFTNRILRRPALPSRLHLNRPARPAGLVQIRP